jgi:hypothetical protein
VTLAPDLRPAVHWAVHRREEARAMTYGVATFEPAGLIVTAAGIAG